MKLVRIDTLYPAYIENLYVKYNTLDTLAYDAQLAAIFADFFAWSNSFTRAYSQLGHECIEIILNAPALQKEWAKENGAPVFYDGSIFDVTLAQVEKFKPDVVFLCDYTLITKSWIGELRRRCPTIKVVVGWCGAPFSDPEVFKGFDYILSDTPEIVETLIQMGHQAFEFKHGFDERILTHFNGADIETKSIPFSFAGSIARNSKYHLKREQLLIYLAEHSPLEIFAGKSLSLNEYATFFSKTVLYDFCQLLKNYEYPKKILNKNARLRKLSLQSEGPKMRLHPSLNQRSRAAVFGLDFCKVIAESLVTLNCHIDISPRTANNIRLYEATGIGTCLLTDWKENLSDIFEPDSEVVVYRTQEECLEKANWLVANPIKAREIGLAGQRRTLKCHNWIERAQKFDKILSRFIR